MMVVAMMMLRPLCRSETPVPLSLRLEWSFSALTTVKLCSLALTPFREPREVRRHSYFMDEAAQVFNVLLKAATQNIYKEVGYQFPKAKEPP